MDATNSVSITGGGYSAQISLLGGQLLSLTHHEDELIVPAAKTEGAFAGAVLAPWPNRTKGGSYTYAGVEHVLPVNEEATGAALHGLLTDVQLDVISQKESEVQLQGWLERSEGYPFGLDIAVTYRVSADIGLAATLMARYRPEELVEEDSPEVAAPQDESSELHEPEEFEEPGESADTDDALSDDVVSEGVAVSEGDAVSEDGSLDADDTDSAGSGDAEDGGAEAGDAAEGDVAETGSDSDETSTAAPETDVAVRASADPHGVDADATAMTDTAVADTGTTDTDDAADTDAESDVDADPVTDADADAEGSEVEPAPVSVPQTAPFGAGFHPYLTAGGASLKECRLRLPAQTMLNTKADGTVTARKPVSQDFDLTNGPLLAGRKIDHAYTGLPEEGWTAELIHDPSGFVVRMIADSPWVQVYTGDRIDRAGVAVEPMTCPPNALNSGEDLIHLVPGEWFRIGYSIEAMLAD